jgi:hypothetical protein
MYYIIGAVVLLLIILGIMLLPDLIRYIRISSM